MSKICCGKKADGEKCGMKIGKTEVFCRHHLMQKPLSKTCMLLDEDGIECGMMVIENQKCAFHTTAKPCLNHDREEQCEFFTLEGDFCHRCKNNRPSIEKLISESAQRMAEKMINKQGTIVRKRVKPKEVSKLESKEVIVPESLVRPNLTPADSCVICLEEFGDSKKSTIKKLSCGHLFHFDCLSGLNALCCPLCRREIKKGQLPNRIYLAIEENINKAQKSLERHYEAEAIRMQEEINEGLNYGIPEEFMDENHELHDLTEILMEVLTARYRPELVQGRVN